MPAITSEDVRAGQAVYSPRLLSWYDLLVLGVSCRCIWKCPAPAMLSLYNDNVSSNHLEVGVGTGYFLDRCRFPSPDPQVGLFDLNPNCLEQTSRRISRYCPTSFTGSVFEPLDVGGRTFDSVGLNFVLHCLPGAMHDKSVVLDNLRTVMKPGAVLFGTTLLSGGVPRGWSARRLMAFYNAKKVFCNRDDSLDALKTELTRRFDDCQVQTEGCGAMFVAP